MLMNKQLIGTKGDQNCNAPTAFINEYIMKTTFTTVLKNKNFLKIWGAQLVSLVCANMLAFILMGRVYQVTDSAIAVGLLWGFFILPSATLGPFVGVFLDYLDKKKVLIFSSLIQSFVVLLFLGVGQKVWSLYTIILLYSFCDEFFNPAIAVLLPSLVKKRELAAANSIFLFTTQGCFVLGFLVGGLMLKFLGFSRYPFLIASILLLFAAILASLLKWKRPIPERKIEVSLAGFWQQLLKGYNFIKNEPKILFPMMLLGGLQIILGMGLILIPSISKDILAIDFADSSFVIILPAVLGAILGGFLVERMIRKYLKRILIINGLFLLGISLLIISLILPLVWFPAVFGSLLAFLMGIAFVLMFIPLQVLIQENTPFVVRGRVFGTLNTLITLAAAIPILGAVTLVDILGVKLVITIGGIGLIILGFYTARGKYGILPNHHRS